MWLGVAHASEVKMGMPEQKDGFIGTLLESKDLKAAGISLIQRRFRTENDVLDATIEGTIDVGFFPLTAFDRRDIKGLQKIYSVFTRPFMFKSGDEIFTTEDSALGDAALADLRHAEIFPLKFWNRGFSKLVARNPISTPRDFERLKVVVASNDATAPTLISLGAEPTQLAKGKSISAAMTKGLAEATVLEPWSRYENSDWKDLAEVSGPLFSIDFEPIIGILAASNAYWSGLSEREKQVWRRAVDEATLSSYKEVNKNEAAARTFSKIKPISIMQKDRYRLIINYSLATPKVAYELKVMDEARTKTELGEAQKKRND
jgi:TRAP-type C4-dicarboxylate transport system substrate-binding protein